jgi:hypothetical protein
MHADCLVMWTVRCWWLPVHYACGFLAGWHQKPAPVCTSTHIHIWHRPLNVCIWSKRKRATVCVQWPLLICFELITYSESGTFRAPVLYTRQETIYLLYIRMNFKMQTWGKLMIYSTHGAKHPSSQHWNSCIFYCLLKDSARGQTDCVFYVLYLTILK